MTNKIQLTAIIIQLWLLVACKKAVTLIEPQVPLTGKVQKLSFFSGTIEDKTYTFGYNIKGVFSSLSIKTTATTQYTPKVDSTGVLLALIQTAVNDTTKYSYTPQGKLKTILYPRGRSENFEYNRSGQLEYYTKQTFTGTAIIYEEIRSNKWQGQKLLSQIISKPGKSFEEETVNYTNDVNPLQVLFEKELRAVAMLEPYGLSPLLPKSSMKIYAGLNVQYAALYDGSGKLLELTIKEETLNGLKDYQKIVISYYK